MSKHTPGPWTSVVTGDGSGRINNSKELGLAITLGAETDEEEIANARLIAAAPDLLSALEGLLERSEQTQHVATAFPWAEQTMAIAALAKAKGKP